MTQTPEQRNAAILARLATLFCDPATLELWLAAPNQGFEGRTPRQLLGAGEVEPILRMLDQLESGAYL